MATVVDFEVVINASNQDVDGQGIQSIYASLCSDLHALTSPAGGVSGGAGNIARKLPIGWKVQFLVDSNTGKDMGTRIKAPDGRTWDPEKCSAGSLIGKSNLWSWFPLLAGGAVFLYLISRKK